MEAWTNELRICTEATDIHRSQSVFFRRGRANPRLILCLLLLACLEGNAIAQDGSETSDEFWPEVGLYVILNPEWRLYFLANVYEKEETDTDDEAHVGANVDYFYKKHLAFSAGYRYGFSPREGGSYQEQRILFEQTFRTQIPWQVLLSDRNREELRWLSGSFSARYRNRLKLERDFRAGDYKLTGYASAEVFYDTRYDTFNRIRYECGVIWTLSKHFGLGMSYIRQNQSRATPNHVNALGVNLVFTLRNR
jgi:uncharacterized protein DUF2490